MGKQNSKLQPGTIEELSKQTEFSEEEIRQWYKDFVHDFPKGYVKLGEFERMYEGFFPNGDASKFARHVFHAFDVDGDGHIDFREFVCGLNAITGKHRAEAAVGIQGVRYSRGRLYF